MEYCKVKFVNNKCYWYRGNYEIGDLVYCDGTQSGVLGRVIDVSDFCSAALPVLRKVGHINPEDRDGLWSFWESLNRRGREYVLRNLGAKRPFSAMKYIELVSNAWTAAGLNGTPWQEFMESIRILAEQKPEEEVTAESEPYFGELKRHGGFLWKELTGIPPRKAVKYHALCRGVVYGTKEMIDAVAVKCDLSGVTEFCNGIFRAETEDESVVRRFPECKVSFFEDIDGVARALYSESGYPFFTYADKKYLSFGYNSRDREWTDVYCPDEIIRDGLDTIYNGGYSKVLIYNAPLDKQFRALDYIIRKDGSIYQMTGVDEFNPPETRNREWVYRECTDGIEICRYRGTDKTVSFPESLDGKRVIGIADRFGDADISYLGMEKAIIPMGYEYIGAYAFADCKKLKEVHLPESLNRIRDGAFLKCLNLSEIILPSGINSFYNSNHQKNGGMFAFFGCSKLHPLKSYAEKVEDQDACYLPKSGWLEYIPANEFKKEETIDRLVRDSDRLAAFENWKTEVKPSIGDRLHLRLKKWEQGAIELVDDRNTVFGVIEELIDDTYVIWSGYSTYLDQLDAVVTSEKQEMGGKERFYKRDGFRIKLVRK